MRETHAVESRGASEKHQEPVWKKHPFPIFPPSVQNFEQKAGKIEKNDAGTASDSVHPRVFRGMDPAKIRVMLEARPFRPFKLVLPSDRELEVPYPEFMAIAPQGSVAVVWGKTMSNIFSTCAG